MFWCQLSMVVTDFTLLDIFLKYDCSSEGISRSLFNLGTHNDGRCHQAFNDHEMCFTGRINVVKCIQLL